MTDLTKFLSQLRRPKLLVRAARMGLQFHRPDQRPSRPGMAGCRVAQLIAEEERLEAGRTSGDSTYSIQSHVGILTALLAESRLRPAPA